jgi:hypothetical protein
MSAEEARYAALRSFGGVEQVKEECRDTWGVRFIDTLLQDLRFGLRQLRRNPGFTLVAILTLALGLGANTAVFSVLNSILLRELPVQEPERVVSLSSSVFSYPDYLDFRDQNKAFEGLCAYLELPPMANLGSSRPPERVMGQLVTGNFFSVLGIKPMLGRGFLPTEDQLANPTAAVMLSADFWRRLGAEPGIVGKTVRLTKRSYTVVGVTPPVFRGVFFGLAPDFWVPMAMLPQVAPAEADTHPFVNRNERSFAIIGRIRHGVTRSQALAETNLINDRIRKAAGGGEA